MKYNFVFYTYGLCTMFYAVMAWIFWRKDNSRMSRLMFALMVALCVECVKDLPFLGENSSNNSFIWNLITSIDMIVIPIYAFILMELVRPGTHAFKKILIHEIPFLLLLILYAITKFELFFWVQVGWAAIYGTTYLIWTEINIPRYNKLLEERLSYREHVSLNWLQYILYSFYAMLTLWVISCIYAYAGVEIIYMYGTLIMWMVVCYFIYNQEQVNDELFNKTDMNCVESKVVDDSVAVRIESLFVDQNIFLNPCLKLSDVAKMIGSNRTYVSNYFNRQKQMTFYEYVNRKRIEHACRLLIQTDDNLNAISENSGFNSLSTFHRVFVKLKGCTPTDFRKQV